MTQNRTGPLPSLLSFGGSLLMKKHTNLTHTYSKKCADALQPLVAYWLKISQPSQFPLIEVMLINFVDPEFIKACCQIDFCFS